MFTGHLRRPISLNDHGLSKGKIFGVVAVLVTLLVAAVTQTNMQFGKLVESIELSESQMYEMFDELEQATDDLVELEGISDSQRLAYFREDVARISGKYERKIATTGKAIRGILLLPWNSSHRNLKTAYLRHNDAWVEHLAERSQNPTLRQSTPIETSWEQFCFQAAKSSPVLAFGRYDTRFTQICTKGSN